MILIGVIVLAAASIFAYYKKNLQLILIPLIVVLILISFFLPWWQVNGSTDTLDTSTKLYIIPNNMITITSTENTLAGEENYIPEEFNLAMNMMIYISIIGIGILIVSSVLEKIKKRRLIFLMKVCTVLLIAGSLMVFIVAINELCKVSVGSIIGQETLDVGVPGEADIHSVDSIWSVDIGFFLYFVAVLILLYLFLKYLQRYREESKKINNGKNSKTIQHPLFAIGLIDWIQLLNKNKSFDFKYIGRAAFITVCSIFMEPIRFLFNLTYKSKIEKSEIKNPPVFIIGHWRSGTSYLHELLSEDPQFCYVSLWHTLLPNSYPLLEPAKEFFSKFLPKERPMDSIEVDIDGPYEEEAAIAVFSQWSFFHGLHFPKNAEEQYLKSIHYEGLSDKEKNEWKNKYNFFMKTVSYTNPGKTLLLKDPANTARIPLLLELFPDAKFIHIYRNPYKVYLSNINMRNKVLDKLALQKGDKVEIEKQVTENYKRLMNSYFGQKKLIPKNRLIEIRYEDLVKDPKYQVEMIYKKLKLTGFKNASTGINRYLDRKKDYKTNVYKIDPKIIDHVSKHWNFTIRLWNYKPPK